MSELDEIEDLLKNGEKEKENAFELIKGKDNKDKNSLAEGLIERGSSLVENEKYDFAITYFKFSEKIALDNEIKENARKHLADAYNIRGVVYAKKDDFDRAIEDYENAIGLNPEFADAYKNRGNAYSCLGRHNEAIKDFSKAIELDSNFAIAYYNRGNAYYDLERYNEGIEDYNKAIELNQEYTKAYCNRGNAYYKLKRYVKAKRDYNKAIKSDQDFYIAHYNLGDLLYLVEEDYDNAEKEYREAVRIEEDCDCAHNGLGLVLSKREAYKNAVAEFKKALKLNKDADYYNNLGCAYTEYGKGSAIAPFILLCAHHKLTKATQEKNTYIKAYKNLTHVGDLLKDEWKILLLRIFIISFVFALSLFAFSINLFELSKDDWLGIILLLTGVATLGIVIFSIDFRKIKIKSLSLGIPGIAKAEFKYEKPKLFKYETPELIKKV